MVHNVQTMLDLPLNKEVSRVHNIQAMLDLHLGREVLQVDVHNIFNSMSWLAIFQEL